MTSMVVRVLLKEAALQKAGVGELVDSLPPREVIYRNAYNKSLEDVEPYLFSVWKSEQKKRRFRRDLTKDAFLKDIQTCDWSGGVLLHKYAKESKTQILHSLLAFPKSEIHMGQFIDLCDNEGRTPLSIAISSGNFEMASLFLANGANANGRETETDMAPLHRAVLSDSPDIVKMLLRWGADRTLTCYCDSAEDYMTPLDLTKRRLRSFHNAPIKECDYLIMFDLEDIYEALIRGTGDRG